MISVGEMTEAGFCTVFFHTLEERVLSTHEVEIIPEVVIDGYGVDCQKTKFRCCARCAESYASIAAMDARVIVRPIGEASA